MMMKKVIGEVVEVRVGYKKEIQEEVLESLIVMNITGSNSLKVRKNSHNTIIICKQTNKNNNPIKRKSYLMV
jgi:23S rRNA C2498 (ribose-2'-O)-methylase RlmM